MSARRHSTNTPYDTPVDRTGYSNVSTVDTPAYRKQGQDTGRSNVTTIDTPVDRLRDSTTRHKDFVPTQPLALDAFPQFPSALHQRPSSPSLTAIFKEDTKYDVVAAEVIPPSPRPTVSLSEVGFRLVLLVRAILLEYRYFWLSFITVAVGLRLLLYAFRYALIIAILLLTCALAWNAIKTMLIYNISPSLFGKIEPPLSTATTTQQQQQRLRDLPQNLPPEPPAEPAALKRQISQPGDYGLIPSWLRWYPIGNFGEATDHKTPVVPPILLQKERPQQIVPSIPNWDVLNSQETMKMREKLKGLLTGVRPRNDGILV